MFLIQDRSVRKKKTRCHHLRLKTWSAIPMLPAVKAFVSTDLGEYCWLLLGMATLPKRSFFHLTWFLCVRDVDSLLWPNQAAMNIQHSTIFFKRVGKKEARTLSFPDASTDCWTIGFCYSPGPHVGIGYVVLFGPVYRLRSPVDLFPHIYCFRVSYVSRSKVRRVRISTLNESHNVGRCDVDL